MAKVYRVKAPERVPLTVTEAGATGSRNQVLMGAWSVATAIGVGLGWYLVQITAMPILAGVPLGICQALVLVRNWKLALLWAGITSVGVSLVLIIFTPMGGPLLVGRAWVDVDGWVSVNIGGSILLLTFIGVPIVAFTQCQALNLWVSRDASIRWFGASVFSFPIVALFGWMLTEIWTPDNLVPGWVPDNLVPGLMYIEPFEPRLWVIGAVWGACTGWALAKMSEVVKSSSEG